MTRLHLQKAKELLLNTDDSITFVAAQTRFEDPAYYLPSHRFRADYNAVTKILARYLAVRRPV